MERFVPYLRKYWFLIALVVVILIITGAYLGGFRVGPGVRISRVGVLVLDNLPPGTSVYVDQTIRGTTSKQTMMSFEFLSGGHNVIVSAPNDYPWSMLATIVSGKTTTVEPILVPTQPHLTELFGTASSTAVAAITASTLPTEDHPLTVANGCAGIYVSNNQVIAKAITAAGCTPPPFLCLGGSCEPTIVYSPKLPITAVLPYPGHSEALLIAVANTLYAIGVDPRSPQFFAPVLGATNPAFATLPNGTVVLENAGHLFSLSL